MFICCLFELLCYYVISYTLCGKYINSTFGAWGNAISVLYVTCRTVGLTIEFAFDSGLGPRHRRGLWAVRPDHLLLRQRPGEVSVHHPRRRPHSHLADAGPREPGQQGHGAHRHGPRRRRYRSCDAALFSLSLCSVKHFVSYCLKVMFILYATAHLHTPSPSPSKTAGTGGDPGHEP